MSDSSPSHSISPAQWEIMQTLREQGPPAARDVYAAFPDGHGWAYKTVKTLLSRLVAKGALDYDQIGNSYLYRANVAQEEVSRQEVRSVLSRIMSKSISPVLAHMIEEADLSSEEITQLQETLRKKSLRKDSGRSSRRKSS